MMKQTYTVYDAGMMLGKELDLSQIIALLRQEADENGGYIPVAGDCMAIKNDITGEWMEASWSSDVSGMPLDGGFC